MSPLSWQAAGVDWLWVTLTVGGLCAMAWLASRIEPHWVSKDGERFICNSQRLTDRFVPDGRWREVRGAVMPDGAVLISQRRRARRRREPSTRIGGAWRNDAAAATASAAGQFWTVTGRSPHPPRRSLVAFVLRGRDAAGATAYLVLRMPASSRAVATLDRISVDAPGRRPGPGSE